MPQCGRSNENMIMMMIAAVDKSEREVCGKMPSALLAALRERNAWR